MIQEYVKKPSKIKAIQFTAGTRSECVAFCNGEHYGDNRVIFIDTLEGRMKAQLGDYIVQGVKGEFYPVKPDIFEALHVQSAPSEPITAEWLRENGYIPTSRYEGWQKDGVRIEARTDHWAAAINGKLGSAVVFVATRADLLRLVAALKGDGA